MRPIAALCFLPLCLLGCANQSSSEHIPLVIAIQPLGQVPSSDISLVKEHLEKTYLAKLKVLPPKPLPKEAYYRPRNRYRADSILTHLERVHRAGKVIALTKEDVSITKGKIKDWGVFGLARLNGVPCIVSTYRMKANPEHRLRNIAVHEVGHTLGRPHCPTPGCVMQDAMGKGATVDRSDGSFCPTCAGKLGKNLR